MKQVLYEEEEEEEESKMVEGRGEITATTDDEEHCFQRWKPSS
jgi:hypothetical protein